MMKGCLGQRKGQVILTLSQRQCFGSLKDHKENFNINPTIRLINPCKSEVGKISKQILEKINKSVRKGSKLNQWRSTDDSVQWFQNIEEKKIQKVHQI